MRVRLPEPLDRLAQVQYGMVSATQAQQAGMSAAAVRSCLRTGRWQVIHRGVYATFTGQPARLGFLWAAVLRAGPGALLSHHTAAELHGLTDTPAHAIHVTIPDSRRIAPIRDVELHLGSRGLMAAHPTALPPRTKIEETVLDLAQIAQSAEEGCAWVARGLGRALTSQGRLLDALNQRPRVHFRAELAEILSPEWAGVHSALEYRYVKWVEIPHSLPRGTHQARAVSGGRRVRRDVLYDGYRLLVELDGNLRGAKTSPRDANAPLMHQVSCQGDGQAAGTGRHPASRPRPARPRPARSCPARSCPACTLRCS
jgi:hypothetical protein